MIKVNELRIGNLVYTDKNDSVKTIVEIRHTCVSIKYIRSDTGNPHQSMVDYDRLIPIPLTEEILLTCGFEKSNIKYIYCKNKIDIEVLNAEYFFNRFSNRVLFSTKIKYLHQLQNLYFALTGDELTVKL